MSSSTMAGNAARPGSWVSVCRVDQLQVDVGVAALVEGVQVALFRLGVDEIRVIGNLDPYSAANVLSRGIVGSRGEAVFVASPMYKQPFDVRTGACLDDPAVRVPTFDVRVVDGGVQVLAPSHREPPVRDPAVQEAAVPEAAAQEASERATAASEATEPETPEREVSSG